MLFVLQMAILITIIGALNLPTCSVVGGGRIGQLLLSSSENNVLVGRNTAMDNLPLGPIYVATRNDALPSVISRCPNDRLCDLVFLQNGYVQNFMNHFGVGDNTQALLFFAVTKAGAKPIDGVTTVNPEGLTAVTGKHSADFAGRLSELNLKCNILDKTSYEKAMYEKLIWISSLMLIGAAKGEATVGDAKMNHSELVARLISEMSASVDVNLEEGTLPRLLAYTDVVADFPCAVKEYEWRNKLFHEKGCELHNSLLDKCVERGVFAFP